jgi:Ni,Fe-hydrogenase III small subunit
MPADPSVPLRIHSLLHSFITLKLKAYAFGRFNSSVMGLPKNEGAFNGSNAAGTEVLVKQPTRPQISTYPADPQALKKVCPANAIGINPVRIDLGKCVFCDACALAFPSKIKFSGDGRVSTNVRDRLIVLEGDDTPVTFDTTLLRNSTSEISLPVQLMVMGNNAEALIAQQRKTASVQFTTLASHAHGLIFTSEITEDQEEIVQQHINALLPPRFIILAGAQAISGGIFGERNKHQTGFMNKYPVDLYIPGNPSRVDLLIDALIEFLSLKQFLKK